MKSTCIALALSVTALTITTTSAESDRKIEIPHGQVSMRFDEFRALFESASKSPPPPEIEPKAALLTAAYEIDWNKNRSLVRADWVVENFTDARTMVPVGMLRAGITPEPDNSAVFLAQGEHLAVLMRTMGPQSAKAVFASRISDHTPDHWSIHFPVVPAATAILRIHNLPADVRVTVRDATELPSGTDDRVFALPACGQEVHIRVEADRPPVPSHWTTRCDVVVTPGDLSLRYQAQVTATWVSGDGQESRIPLPSGAQRIVIHAETLRAWTIESDPNGTPVAVVTWNDSAATDRTLEIAYSLPVEWNAKSWTLYAPGSSGETSGNHTFAVLHSPTLELHTNQNTDNPHADDTALSGWMRDRIRGKEFSVFQSAGSIELTLAWLPLVEPANLMVRIAQFKSRLVPDGSQLMEAEVDVEFDTLTAWQCRLPTTAKLLECSVNGDSIRPIQRGDSIEIPLEAPNGAGKARIRISYTDQGTAFDPVSGGISLELPVSPTFIHALRWSVDIPRGYEVAGIESNAEVVRSNEHPMLTLEQELIRGTPVIAEIFYRKQGLQQ